MLYLHLLSCEVSRFPWCTEGKNGRQKCKKCNWTAAQQMSCAASKVSGCLLGLQRAASCGQRGVPSHTFDVGLLFSVGAKPLSSNESKACAHVIFTLRTWGGPFWFHHDSNPVHTQSEVHRGVRFLQVLRGWIWPAWDTFNYLFNYSGLLFVLIHVLLVLNGWCYSFGLHLHWMGKLLESACFMFEAALPPSPGLNGSLPFLCAATWLHHCLRL